MIEDFYKYSPYELDKEQKNELLTNELISLTKAHAERCEEYKNFLETINFDESKVNIVEDIPG